MTGHAWNFSLDFSLRHHIYSFRLKEDHEIRQSEFSMWCSAAHGSLFTGGRLHATDKFSCILPSIKAQVYISRAASQALHGGCSMPLLLRMAECVSLKGSIKTCLPIWSHLTLQTTMTHGKIYEVIIFRVMILNGSLLDAGLFWNQRVATLSRSLHVKTLPRWPHFSNPVATSVFYMQISQRSPLSHTNQTNTASKLWNWLLEIT